MRVERRASEKKKLNIGKVVLVLVILVVLIVLSIGIYKLVKNKTAGNNKQAELNNDNKEETVSKIKTKTIEEILNEFGAELLQQVNSDTYYISKDGEEYTAYLDGEIVKGRIVPWSGNSAKPAVDEVGNMNIYNADELRWVAEQVINGQMNFSGVTITIRNNIDLGARKNEDGTWSGNEWTSIIGFLNTDADDTTNEENLKRFAGTIEGMGCSIRGLYINSDKKYQGLLGYNSGTVTNLKLINCSITGGEGTGAIVGLNEGRVLNCKLENVQVSGTEKVGGIVGINMTDSSINGCDVLDNTIIKGDKYVGGIAGYVNNNSEISNVSNTASVTGTEYIGGVAGISFYGTTFTGVINQSINISGENYVGGVVGYSSSQLENVSSTGNVTGKTYVGGITGVNYDMGNITNSYNSAKITVSGDIAGGITGLNNSSISNCYNIGSIDASESEGVKIGGICGENASSCYIYTSYNIGAITTNDVANGLIGANFGDVSDCFYLDTCIEITPKEDSLKKTETEMKNDIINSLGDSFIVDENNTNSGFPILSWQKSS